MSARGISSEKIGVVCELIVFEPVFPIVERGAVIRYWLEAVRGKIGVGTRVSDDVSKSNRLGRIFAENCISLDG
jgi:hypothetical protein